MFDVQSTRIQRLVIGACAGSAALLLSAASAQAADYSFMSRAGAESGFGVDEAPHSAGMFMRAGFGMGLGSTTVRPDGISDNFSLRGFALGYELAVGGVIAPGTVMHMTFVGNTAPGVSMHQDGSSIDLADFGVDVSRTTLLLGAGFTRYSPTGFFMTFSAGAVNQRLRQSFSRGSSASLFLGENQQVDWGFGVDGMVGMEFLMSPYVGLGVGLAGGGHFIPSFGDGAEDGAATGFNIGVRFVMTLN